MARIARVELWMEKRKTAIHITHSIPEAVPLAIRDIFKAKGVLAMD